MFIGLSQTREILGKSEEEVKQLCRQGRLREFRDGPRLMFKTDQVEQLKQELENEAHVVLDLISEGRFVAQVHKTALPGPTIGYEVEIDPKVDKLTPEDLPFLLALFTKARSLIANDRGYDEENGKIWMRHDCECGATAMHFCTKCGKEQSPSNATPAAEPSKRDDGLTRSDTEYSIADSGPLGLL